MYPELCLAEDIECPECDPDIAPPAYVDAEKATSSSMLNSFFIVSPIV